jgi:hypothetical protein
MKNSILFFYMVPHVVKVRFLGGTDGKPLQILVDRKDGTSSVYSDQGVPVDSPPPSPSY